MANGLMGRRNMKQALTQRGERGVRIADLEYKKGHLELGMLNGNAFIITLRYAKLLTSTRVCTHHIPNRNVKVADENVLNGVMESMKRKGYINYYGMIRKHAFACMTISNDIERDATFWHLLNSNPRDRTSASPV
jgi:tRNA pseudouridine13 synthase